MTDTLLPPADDVLIATDEADVTRPEARDRPPSEPGNRRRSRPWGLIIGIVITTLLIAGFVIGVLMIGAAGASAAGGCGGG